MRVEFIYEPPQQGSATDLVLERHTAQEEQVWTKQQTCMNKPQSILQLRSNRGVSVLLSCPISCGTSLMPFSSLHYQTPHMTRVPGALQPLVAGAEIQAFLRPSSAVVE